MPPQLGSTTISNEPVTPDSVVTALPPAGLRSPRRRQNRGDGQWALGYREPLNKNEELKKNDDGLNVRNRIIDIYSKLGFDSIDPADLRGRFRWFGLYTQRRQGIDGGKTATLEPEELDDRYFMMRVRIDGGQLSTEQLSVIADVVAPLRAGHRRRDRPAEHPAALGADRGRPRDLGGPGVGGAVHHRGVRRHPPGLPGLPAGGHRRRGDHRRDPGDPRDGGQVRGRPRVLQPAAQVQVRAERLRGAVHRARDQRRRVRGRDRAGWRARLRPVGGRRAVHQPHDRQAAGRVCPAGPGGRGLGRGHLGLPRLRLPQAAAPGPAEVPDGRLGTGAVP